MVKVPVQFRLSEEMLDRLDWLAGHYGTSRTDVVRLAITRLYEEERENDVVILVPAGDGMWKLTTDGTDEFARIGSDLLSRFPKGLVERLKRGVRRGEAWPLVLLTFAAVEARGKNEGED